ncbi:MAG: hypothetical protein ACHREM_12970 [Polyangiales bacterium]
MKFPALHVAAIAALSLSSSCGASTPAGSVPIAGGAWPGTPYVTVHIDTLLPDKAPQFMSARRAWVDELERAHAADHRGWFFEVPGERVLTMQPLARFADLDGGKADRENALEKVPKAALEKYDRLCDESLAFPHTSEIWRVDADLSYAPADAGIDLVHAGAIRMTLDDVRADTASVSRYDDAWAQVKVALAAAHYPLTRVAFHTVYGSGRRASFWLAKTKAQLDAAPDLTKTIGLETQAILDSAIAASVLRHEVRDVVPRMDLSSP